MYKKCITSTMQFATLLTYKEKEKQLERWK